MFRTGMIAKEARFCRSPSYLSPWIWGFQGINVNYINKELKLVEILKSGKDFLIHHQFTKTISLNTYIITIGNK